MVVGTKSLEYLEPIDLGKLQVEQDDFGEVVGIAPGVFLFGKEEVQALLTVAHVEEIVGKSLRSESTLAERGIGLAVLDEQNLDVIDSIFRRAFLFVEGGIHILAWRCS